MPLSPRTIRAICGKGWDMEETMDLVKWSVSRRAVMLSAVRFALGLAGWGAVSTTATAATPPEDRGPFMKQAFEMQRLAIERGDQPFGAVIVKDGQVVGEGVSAVITTPDPTAHGEMQAIRDAALRLNTARLDECELYTTFRPCPMCETAAYWARIARVYYGEAITDAGAPSYRSC